MTIERKRWRWEHYPPGARKRQRRYRPPESKRCYVCKQTFPLEDFPVDRGKADCHKSLCRPSDRAKARAHYAQKVATP